jgi:hypothetical protein
LISLPPSLTSHRNIETLNHPHYHRYVPIRFAAHSRPTILRPHFQCVQKSHNTITNIKINQNTYFFSALSNMTMTRSRLFCFYLLPAIHFIPSSFEFMLLTLDRSHYRYLSLLFIISLLLLLLLLSYLFFPFLLFFYHYLS